MNRHLSKMFAGLQQIKLLKDENDEETIIIGMASKEGEVVMFKEHVDVRKYKKIQWFLS